jgi:hypothetical protein
MSAVIYFIWFARSPHPELFLSMNVHPLLIMVGLTSLRYGNYLGILSATVASAVFIYAHFLLGRDLVIFFIAWEYYKFLLMFYLAAVILGSFRDHNDQKISELSGLLSEADHDLDALTQAQKKSQFVNIELKKQIVGTEDSILSLYSLASSLESLRPEVLYTEVASVLARFLRVQAVTIYTADKSGHYLRLKISMGHETTPPRSLRTEDFGYLAEVVIGKQAYRISADSDSHSPVFSAPLQKDGHVIAVINVDKADFQVVTEYYFNLFKIIVEWVSKSLIRALEVEESFLEDRYHAHSRVLKLEYFRERVAEEKKRFNKYGLPYSLLRFKNPAPLMVISQKLSDCLRQIDVLGYDEQEDELLLLLPLADAQAMDIVKKRIAGCLELVNIVGEGMEL